MNLQPERPTQSNHQCLQINILARKKNPIMYVVRDSNLPKKNEPLLKKPNPTSHPSDLDRASSKNPLSTEVVRLKLSRARSARKSLCGIVDRHCYRSLQERKARRLLAQSEAPPNSRPLPTPTPSFHSNPVPSSLPPATTRARLLLTHTASTT